MLRILMPVPRLLLTTGLLAALVLAAWLLSYDGGRRRVVGPYMGGVTPSTQDRAPRAPPPRVGLALQPAAAATDGGPPRPFGLALLVRDEGGEPLPGVSIFRQAEAGFPAPPAPRRRDTTLAATTDARGRAYIGAISQGSVVLAFRSPDWCPQVRSFATRAAGLDVPPEEVVLLRPGGLLRFEVVDEDGQPLAGAEVRVQPLDVPGLDLLDVATDARGIALCPWPPGQDLGVDILRSGHVLFRTWIATTALSGDTDLHVVLPRGRRVAGHLLGADGEALRVAVAMDLQDAGRGKPARGQFHWIDPTSLNRPPLYPWIEQDPGTDGAFVGWAPREEPAPPLRLIAWNADRRSRVFDLDPAQPTEGLELTWDQEAAERTEFVHRLVDVDGEPVRGARVGIWHRTAEQHPNETATLSDDDGLCRWSAPRSWGPPTFLVVQEASGIQHDLDMPEGDIVLRPLGALYGRVQEHDGTVPAEAWIELTWGGTWPVVDGLRTTPMWTRATRSVRCDVRGEFQALGLEPGPWQVRASVTEGDTPDERPAGQTVRVAADGATLCEEVFVLTPRRVLHGRVRDGAGRAVPGALVQLHAPPGGSVPALTDHAGRFLVRHARRGAARLVVDHDGLRAERLVDLTGDGDMGPIDLTLLRPAVLVVRFTGRVPPDGLPVGVEYSPVGAPRSHTTRGTVFGGVLHTRLPIGLRPDAAYEVWAQCGMLLGDITPLPEDLAGRDEVEVEIFMRLPEDDLPLDMD